MDRHVSLRGRALLIGAGCLVGLGTLATTTVARANASPGWSLASLTAYGGEPSLATDGNGVLYDTSPSGPVTYRSTDQGTTWTQIQSADNNSGDDCLATDASNALYWCNLASTSQGQLPLQADEWKSTVASTCTTSCGWVHGDGAIPGQCSTSCQPFGVDRQWTAAEIPAGGTTDTATVVLMYHDFYGPSHIWVNISHDGGKTFGASQEVLSSPAVTPGAVTGTLTAEGYTFCNTVPIGTAIAPLGTPHAGRIYVAWIAADLPTDATGCNISQAEAFHTMWVSYSDDGGSTWTPQMAFDAGVARDASSPFAAFTLDDQGNPYIGFTSETPGTTSYNPATCSAESTAGTVQSDPTCSFNAYVVWSADGGATWDGGGGLIPGSAGSAYQVSPATQTGTDVFPTIAARDPGQVDFGYLHTDTINPTDSAGKFLPGGCAGPIQGNPPTYPPACDWNLWGAQSLNLTAAPGTATFTAAPITDGSASNTAGYMHIGDICNLGIACGPTSNRNLLDFNMEVIDPTTGCAHIAYADDNSVNKLRVANQTSGCIAPSTVLGEAPMAALLLPFAAVAFIGTAVARRRRSRAAVA